MRDDQRTHGRADVHPDVVIPSGMLPNPSAVLKGSEGKLPVNPGVGMPAALKLHQFGRVVMDAWPDALGCFHVGSSLHGKSWRDVDVRLMLTDEDFAAEFDGPLPRHDLPRWRSMCLAFATLGREMTSLPIDFQIHPMTWANETYPESRSALGVFR